jgi:TolB-like protein/class 3 adenylate cyclase/cytochrome c-type biogenesis protein CcmH/NrfG
MERRLAAILAADVVGYSRLMEADEADALAALKSHRQDLIDTEIAEHHGRIVKLMGDGALVEFASVVDAVACATAIQDGMVARNEGVPEERRIVFRIGVHLGDVMVEDDDLYGDGVNVAARLEGLAEPGGICISQQALDQVETKLDLAYEDLGEQQVKNIARPVRTYRVLREGEAPPGPETAKRRGLSPPQVIGSAFVVVLIVVGVSAGLWRPWKPDVEPASIERMAFPLPEKPSIAVLPFANMSAEPEQEYFADGMTEDLITDLAKISGLFVIARNSSFSYKGKSIDVKQVARELGVKYILEGSVRRAGDQVRISTQLVDASTGGHLWAERYDERVDNVFALQDQVAREIIAVLKVKLTVADEESLEHNPRPVNLEAYEWLLKGRKELAAQDRKSSDQAKVYFERSIEADPTYARAYTNLGFYYWQEWRIWGRAKATNLDKAKEIGRKAVELDFLSAGARVLLAVAHQTDGEHLEADKWGSEALRLKPTQAETLGNLGVYLLHAGRYEDAIAIFSKAVRLDPLHPPQWLSWLGHAHLMMGETQKAIEILQAGIARGPDYIAFHVFLAASYAVMNEHEKAQAQALEVLRLNNRFTVSAYERYAMGNTKNENDVRRMAAALRNAGLPE